MKQTVVWSGLQHAPACSFLFDLSPSRSTGEKQAGKLPMAEMGKEEVNETRGAARQPPCGRSKPKPPSFWSRVSRFRHQECAYKDHLEPGPAEMYSPIQYRRFHVAEAIGLRAGQQQDISLCDKEPEHTTDTETLGWLGTG